MHPCLCRPLTLFLMYAHKYSLCLYHTTEIPFHIKTAFCEQTKRVHQNDIYSWSQISCCPHPPRPQKNALEILVSVPVFLFVCKQHSCVIFNLTIAKQGQLISELIRGFIQQSPTFTCTSILLTNLFSVSRRANITDTKLP